MMIESQGFSDVDYMQIILKLSEFETWNTLSQQHLCIDGMIKDSFVFYQGMER